MPSLTCVSVSSTQCLGCPKTELLNSVWKIDGQMSILFSQFTYELPSILKFAFYVRALFIRCASIILFKCICKMTVFSFFFTKVHIVNFTYELPSHFTYELCLYVAYQSFYLNVYVKWQSSVVFFTKVHIVNIFTISISGGASKV